MGPTQSGRSYSGASSIEGTGAEKPVSIGISLPRLHTWLVQ